MSLTSSNTQSKLLGTQRFQLLRRLGSGGFGVVYEAFDEERGCNVALKLLRDEQSNALYHFKREFRALADLIHPNLVRLYELHADAGQWYFTMELVRGRPLLECLRSVAAVATGASSRTDEAVQRPRREKEPRRADPTTPTMLSIDVRRVARQDPAKHTQPWGDPNARVSVMHVAPVFLQIVDGLMALHDAGFLHCDVKPHNVLVTEDQRAVLLDFGVVADKDAPQTSGAEVLGTPTYMSPEQCRGLRLTESSDWYSVGVMLYEALTGCVPLAADGDELMRLKQSLLPAPANTIAPSVPDDLSRICQRLLSRAPEQRPTGRELAEVLARHVEAHAPQQPGDSAAQPRNSIVRPITSRGVPSNKSTALKSSIPFVGRSRELAVLEHAFEEQQQGRAVVVEVHGASGIGKTALLDAFGARLRVRHPDALLLRSRCHERESVPYKAVDPIVDELARTLLELSEPSLSDVTPRDLDVLARLFPALGFQRSEAVDRGAPLSRELRTRAFSAFRELMQRVSQRKRLVLVIDDLQWGDLESRHLLEALLDPPGQPAILLVLGYRSDDASAMANVPNLERVEQHIVRHDLPLAALEPGEARKLIGLLDHGRGSASDKVVGAMIAESAGHPFFLLQLVEHRHAHPDPTLARPTSLAEVVGQQVRALPDTARHLLEAVAVAAHPLQRPTAAVAAGITRNDYEPLATLQAARLVRSAGTEKGARLEAYHDRIREIVARSLSRAQRRAIHARLAEALEQSTQRTSPETLALHWRDAGFPERAAPYALFAARDAEQALAFNRAADLYRLAVECAPQTNGNATANGDATGDATILTHLGDVLANAGRGAEAAQAYLEAAGMAPERALELRRRAAMQLITAGHVDNGVGVMRDVLRELGIRYPATGTRALASLLARRTRLRLRGLKYATRAEQDVPAELLLRIDTCWAAAITLSIVDTIRGADFQTLHLLLALEAGEPYRMSRALSVEAGYLAAEGPKTQQTASQLSARAKALASRVAEPQARGLALLTEGMCHALTGDFQGSLPIFEQAETILRSECTGVTWECNSLGFFVLDALRWSGQYRQLAARAEPLVTDAMDRGDYSAVCQIRAQCLFFVRLADDDPKAALTEVETSVAMWRQQTYPIQRYWEGHALAEIRLYEGQGAAAYDAIAGLWPVVRSAMLLYVHNLRVEILNLRGRAALLAADQTHGRQRATLLRRAARDARALGRERSEWSQGLASLLLAGVARARGRDNEALAALEQAVVQLEQAGIEVYRVVALRRLGMLTAGPEGQARIQDADTWMRARGLQRPERHADRVAPGSWWHAPAPGWRPMQANS